MFRDFFDCDLMVNGKMITLREYSVLRVYHVRHSLDAQFLCAVRQHVQNYASCAPLLALWQVGQYHGEGETLHEAQPCAYLIQRPRQHNAQKLPSLVEK